MSTVVYRLIDMTDIATEPRSAVPYTTHGCREPTNSSIIRVNLVLVSPIFRESCLMNVACHPHLLTTHYHHSITNDPGESARCQRGWSQTTSTSPRKATP